MNRRRFLAATPLLALPSLALGQYNPMQKHIGVMITGSNPVGTIPFILSATESMQIKSWYLSCEGPAFAAGEKGMMYLWWNGGHITHFLNIGTGTPLDRGEVPGKYGLVMPANTEYCFTWSFQGLSQPRYIFGGVKWGTPE